jgi:tetratricopeptide (TPR) repeat protein
LSSVQTVLGELPGEPSSHPPVAAAPSYDPNEKTLGAISPDQAAAQEQHALDMLRASMERRVTGMRVRFVNPLPQDVRDRFKGRSKEQADIIRLLGEKARLISIYGRGGVGKTALASKVLADLQQATDESAPDGMVYLSAVSTGISLDRIFADFGRLLGADIRGELEKLARDPGTPTAQKVTALLDALGSGRYLLLLDNLEPLQNAETGALTDPDLQTFLDVALSQGSSLQIVITSREPLALPRELKVWERLAPLEEGLQLEDAVELLRASDPDGAAGLRDAPYQKLMQIAEQMRGFPRALEAVVGLLLEDSLMSLDDLLNHDRDGPAQDSQITTLIVQQAIERLSQDSLRVVEALAVFEIPVKQVALEYLLAPLLDTSNLRALLNRLVRSYFVAYNKAVQTFSLHPIDREYCYRRVPEGTPADKPAPGTLPHYTRCALHYRAADFYDRQRKPQDAWKAIGDLEPQLAQFEHLLQARDYEAATLLYLDIVPDYMYQWGYYRRTITMGETLLADLADPTLKCKILMNLSNSYDEFGRKDLAISYDEQALEMARQAADAHLESRILGNIGTIYYQMGQFDRALDYEQQSLTISHANSFRKIEANARLTIGIIYDTIAQPGRATEYLQEALVIQREVQDRKGEGIVLSNLGAVHLNLGQFERAIEFLQQAREVRRELNYRRGEAIVLDNLATINYMLGQYEQAMECCQQSLDISRDIEDRGGEASILGLRGKILVQVGSHAQGIQTLRTSLTISEEIDSTYDKGHVGYNLALGLLLSGDVIGACDAIQAARAQDVADNNADAANLAGLILIRSGESEAANAAFNEALRYADHTLQESPGLYSALYSRAMAHAGLALADPGHAQAAADDIRAARAVTSAAGIITAQLLLLDVLTASPGGEALQPVRAALGD